MEGGTRRAVEVPRLLAPVPEALPQARAQLRDLVAASPFARRLEDGEPSAPAPVELSHARRSYVRRVLAQLGT